MAQIDSNFIQFVYNAKKYNKHTQRSIFDLYTAKTIMQNVCNVLQNNKTLSENVAFMQLGTTAIDMCIALLQNADYNITQIGGNYANTKNTK